MSDPIKNKKVSEGFQHLKRILAEESTQSKTMIETYGKWLAQKATPSEMEQANKQFQNVLKTVGLGTLFILPGGMVTLPLAVLAAKKLGIDLLPASFKKPEN